METISAVTPASDLNFSQNYLFLWDFPRSKNERIDAIFPLLFTSQNGVGHQEMLFQILFGEVDQILVEFLGDQRRSVWG